MNVIVKLFSTIDMVTHMKQFIESGGAVDDEVRNLLSVAYKNKIGARRSSWRIISSEESRASDSRLEILKEYKLKIEQELSDIHAEVLTIIDKYLLKDDDPAERKVFFYKM